MFSCGHRYAVGMLDKATGKMQAMSAEAGRIIRMEPRCPGVDYEDTGAGVRSEPLDAETRMKEYKRYPLLLRSKCTITIRLQYHPANAVHSLTVIP